MEDFMGQFDLLLLVISAKCILQPIDTVNGEPQSLTIFSIVTCCGHAHTHQYTLQAWTGKFSLILYC